MTPEHDTGVSSRLRPLPLEDPSIGIPVTTNHGKREDPQIGAAPHRFGTTTFLSASIRVHLRFIMPNPIAL
jgi:hypothetical protein